MLNITNYCFKKKSEINIYFLLNTYSFSTLKFNSLRYLITGSPIYIDKIKKKISPNTFKHKIIG